MKRIFKRLVAGASLAAMVLGTVAATGCTGGASGGELTEIKIFSQLANFSGYQTGWWAEIMKEKFGVRINIVNDPDGNVLTTMLESGEMADINIWGDNGAQYRSAVTGGLLLDWNKDELVQNYGPYIYENMQQALIHNQELNQAAYKAAGIEGTAPTVGFGHNVATNPEDHESFMYSWDLRFDLYQELGCPEIKDLDGLVEVLLDMKEICPTDELGNPTYAVAPWNDWDGNMVMYVKSTASCYYGYDEFGTGLYDPATGKYYGPLDEDGPYIEMIRFYNKLYRLGLMDPESETRKWDGMAEKMKLGGYFFSIFNYAGSEQYNTDEHLAEGKAMYSVAPTEATPVVYGMDVNGGNRVWSIGANTKYPDICMQIINYLCTPEGRLTTDYGPKGLCWDYDENGKTYFTELGAACAADTDTVMTTDNEEYAKYCGTMFSEGNPEHNNTTWSTDAINPESGEPYNRKKWESNVGTEAKSEIEKEWREWAGADSVTEYFENRGTDSYVVEIASGFELTPLKTYSASLQTNQDQIAEIIRTKTWQAMTADTEEACDAYIEEMIKNARAYTNVDTGTCAYDEITKYFEEQAAARKATQDAVIEHMK